MVPRGSNSQLRKGSSMVTLAAILLCVLRRFVGRSASPLEATVVRTTKACAALLSLVLAVVALASTLVMRRD